MSKADEYSDASSIRQVDHHIDLPGLSVADGKVMIQLIDRVATSGKLKGEELLPVGSLRQLILDNIKVALEGEQQEEIRRNE